MVPFMIIGMKKQKEKQMFTAAVALLTLALAIALVFANGYYNAGGVSDDVFYGL